VSWQRGVEFFRARSMFALICVNTDFAGVPFSSRRPAFASAASMSGGRSEVAIRMSSRKASARFTGIRRSSDGACVW